MRKMTRALGVAVLLAALSACGGGGLESAHDACVEKNPEHAKVMDVTDDGTVLIDGTGVVDSVGAMAAFMCIAGETDAPDSIVQKVGATRGMDGRQDVDYDGTTASWGYTGGAEPSFSATFETD